MDNLEVHSANISTETFISLQDSLALGFVIALVVMSGLNVMLHSVGTYLCITVYRDNNSIQITNLINLSLTQALASLVVLLDEASELIYDMMGITEGSTAMWLRKLDVYLYIVIYVLFCIYYIVMLVITLDKFFEVYLNIRYPIFWDVNKSKRLTYLIWLVSVCVCVLLCVIYHFRPFNYQMIFTEIVSPLFNFTFLLVAVVSYVYIFRRFRHTRTRHPSLNGSKTRESMYTTFRNSNFHLCALLVVSFIVFMVAPNLAYLFHGWAGQQRSHASKDAIKVSYQLSFLVDFAIYVIMQPEIRGLCLKKVRRCRCSQEQSDHQTSFL